MRGRREAAGVRHVGGRVSDTGRTFEETGNRRAAMALKTAVVGRLALRSAHDNESRDTNRLVDGQTTSLRFNGYH